MAKLFGIALAGAVGLMATKSRAGRGLRRGLQNWGNARARKFRERTRRLVIKSDEDEDRLVRTQHPAELFAAAPKKAHGDPHAQHRRRPQEHPSEEPQSDYPGSAKWHGDPLFEAISER